MFRGYQQHDTQEFLRCFMDQLHEELKEPVPDNSHSIEKALIRQGIFIIFCINFKKKNISFYSLKL